MYAILNSYAGCYKKNTFSFFSFFSFFHCLATFIFVWWKKFNRNYKAQNYKIVLLLDFYKFLDPINVLTGMNVKYINSFFVHNRFAVYIVKNAIILEKFAVILFPAHIIKDWHRANWQSLLMHLKFKLVYSTLFNYPVMNFWEMCHSYSS